MRRQIFSADCIEIPQAYCRSQFILVRHSFVLGQNPASNAVAWQGISGQSAGKYASRLRAKPSGGLYSAFPYVPMNNVIITSLCKVCYRGNVKSRLNVKSCGMSFVNSEKSTEFRYIFSQHAPKWQPFSQEIPLKRQIPAVCPLRQVIDK